MATSGSYNWNDNRDAIITRALRICGGIGTGETPDSTAVTEASGILNDIVKEWNADGMPLWAIREYTVPLTAATATYNIGVGATVSAPSPLKVIQGWIRITASSTDSPLLIITRNDYNLMGNKTTQGVPNQIWYSPPGPIASVEMVGILTVYPVPDTATASSRTIRLLGQRSFEDFDAAGDVPDFPTYWNNAIIWGLADQLAYDYHVPLAERSMISKKAMYHKEVALSFGTEEGSIFLAPQWNSSP